MDGGLKDIDISSKFKSLHINWLTRLFDENYHPWKQIPLYFFKRVSLNFHLFHTNLLIPDCYLKNIPMFYKNIISYWQDISISPLLVLVLFFLSHYVLIHSLGLIIPLFTPHLLIQSIRSIFINYLMILVILFHGMKLPRSSI